MTTQQNYYELEQTAIAQKYKAYLTELDIRKLRLVVLTSYEKNSFAEQILRSLISENTQLAPINYCFVYVSAASEPSRSQEPLNPLMLRELVEGLDPQYIISLDLLAAQLLATSYSVKINTNCLVYILGRRALCFDKLEDMQQDEKLRPICSKLVCSLINN